MMGLTPEQAVDRLQELHASACDNLRSALARFASSGTPPTPRERQGFRYPELIQGQQRVRPGMTVNPTMAPATSARQKG